ncbi:SIT4 phosphatase-associated protein [Colletotrichum scovillei]|uniref:SIT4 phosphatase-associated protein n=1 Tax=Colletotrichum scovillei TaxID=1209932 RepID=A0A9P7U945_9PEZI|nr:SIT4 phosphatase-associated protein [Colletotrichum scovillei]KAF4781170.1 SIT4 phosphatase-associated protein [Colletotrichum scovillei]KAG7045085.1 SIT4 phosphatase-associated protein [Colletotrichum scovillei]KAG7052249.1 SIT4 phosphatase-associated protein [Colletotrichum scovillei]KAG7064539.1 SIT4 phosphatase-associated protein [Colletotrichum scovillei]
MFWRFGGYANISTIDTILEKPEFTVEDLLDESDLIQELKQHNTKLIEYLREDNVLKTLLEYVVAPKLEPVATPETDEPAEEIKGKGRLLPFSRPRASSRATDTDNEEEEQEKKRNRYAYVAAEVLSSDTWSIYEAMMENQDLVREFWQFLKRPTPLDPLQASYFTKVNEALFDKKTEEMVILLKSLPEAVPDLLRHVECPMIMDLLLKIIALDRTEGGQGVVEWLYGQDVVPTLLSCLSPEHSWVVQTAAGDFIKAIITISANASQNEQQCIGPNELTRQLVSQPCVEQLIKYMLGGGNPLTVGVGIIIEVIRKNNSDYDPDVGTEANSVPSSRDPIYLGTLLRLFAQHIPDFVNLIMNTPVQKGPLESTFGEKIEPLGFDRFKTCELMAELLHCSNMGLLNEVGSEDVIAARDAERQRLRTEGKLTPNRGEEPPSSTDDLTMRIGRSSPEEGRRLEVTNISDDDGFEEVEPSREMNEDTSHEFVKAEEEIPVAAPASSFLDRDEDDFVDEPLSSPRLNVADDKIKEQRFDDPDLVVAPLSPSKPKTASIDETAAAAADSEAKSELEPKPDTIDAKSEEPAAKESESEKTEKTSGADDLADKTSDDATINKVEELSLDEKADQPVVPEDNQKGDESDSSVVYTPSVTDSETKTEPVETAPAVPEPPQHPEDMPAPLFSKSTTDPDATADKDDTSKETESEVEPAPEVPMAPPVPEVPEAPVAPGTDDDATKEAGDLPPAVPDRPDPNSVKPVVGDYLKVQFVEYRVVPTILSFFFAYPWNNFLHNVVYDIVQQVFNGPMDRGYNPTLAVSLFEAADITTAIIKGQLASDESQARMKTRMGYMGHLTLIAEEVVKFTERHPPELLSETVLERVMDPRWISYVEGALAETRERDNAILGGVRPEVAMGNRAGMSGNGLAAVGLSGLGSSFSNSQSNTGSNALADAGLNGNADLQESSGNGIGPFAISSGTLMSGFGSSSDEEDEGEEENEDDVNNEFRAYTDPLNNTSSSLNPPSIPPPPPPPPPLNNPPSRARLQLAARLAMHQKNQAAASQEDDDDKDESGEGERPENPFADDEDDEENSSDEDDEDRHGPGAAAAVAGAWGQPGSGSWWRGVGRQGRPRFDGQDDSDEEDDDEEFGDFAMPEVEPAPGTDPNEKVILKPLAVHPPQGASGGKAFSGLWPFAGKKDGKDDGEKGLSEETATGDDEKPIQAAVEAARRTSIEDPDDDEEVVVQKPTSL